jgi:hypothetical protein
MPLPAMKTAKRCTAKAKSTGQQCENPAAYGCRTCRFHGARKRENIKRGPDHPQYVHGEATQEAKAATAKELRELRRLEGNLKRLLIIK